MDPTHFTRSNGTRDKVFHRAEQSAFSPSAEIHKFEQFFLQLVGHTTRLGGYGESRRVNQSFEWTIALIGKKTIGSFFDSTRRLPRPEPGMPNV